VVFAHLDVGDYSENDFADLPSGIKRRPFIPREVDAAEARRAMRYAGHDDWEPSSERYLILDDGIRQFVDCDLSLIVSDRLCAPILPLRPIALMVYDYLQRYVPILTKGADQPFIDAARIVERVFVTTDFTRQDALQYGGVSPQKLVKLPMLIPRFHQERRDADTAEPDYFIWATNAAPHKNRQNAFRALDIYYGELGGGLRCVITGVNTDTFLSSSIPDLRPEMAGLKSNKRVLRRLTFSGYLTDDGYRRLLSGAAFLWHPARIDNDTFSVIEAASLGVPALSSDYPAMREINEQFRLGLSWMDADAPRSMAKALKEMECHWKALRKKLPTPEELASQDVKRLAGGYWKAIRECL
jgi:glycosyltransferase involved in cell wall biosynthesis